MEGNNSLIQSFLFSDESEKCVVVNGNSMWPFLLHGQTVRVAPLKKPLKRGWCYLFINDNSIFIHRLVKVLDGNAVFAGDYSDQIEEIPLTAVIGELKQPQNKIFICILNLINHIFIYGALAIAAKTRMRNRILSVILKIEKKIYERKI